MEYPWEKDENYDETAFDEENETFWEEDLNETDQNKTFEKTEEGMLSLFAYLKTEAQMDFAGWSRLWNNYDEFMTTEFRMLVALTLATSVDHVGAVFPEVCDWVCSIDPKDIYVSKDKEKTVTLRELIVRTLKSGELVRSMFVNSEVNRDVLRLASGIMNLCQDWVDAERDEPLLTVYWMKTLYSALGHVQVQPTVDFIRKRDLIKKFTIVPEYDDILQQGIHKLEEIQDYEICSLIRAGTRCIVPIYMDPKKMIMMLDAEVPRVLDDRAGFVVRNYLLGCLGKKTETSRFEISVNQEFFVDEMRDVIRVTLINKLNFYKAVREVWTAMDT